MDEKNIGKAYLAELLGTFILVASIIFAATVYAGAIHGQGSATLVGLSIPFIALAHGFALFIAIQSLGAISGGHFNPAVTLGLLSIGKIKVADALLYIVAQVIGATLAALLLVVALHDQGQIVAYGAPGLSSGISVGSGIVLEALGVFFLVWAVVATAVNPDGPKEWAPLAISTSLALGVLLVGAWTGAALNPARAFGPDLINAIFGKPSTFGSFKDFILVYTLAPIASGVLAATLYNALYIKRDKPVPSPAPSEQSPI